MKTARERKSTDDDDDDDDDVGLTPFPSGLPLRGRTRVGRRAERAARRRRTGQTRTS